MVIIRENNSLGRIKRHTKLFFVKNVLDKFYKIVNIDPNEKYENRPNLPDENGKCTLLANFAPS